MSSPGAACKQLLSCAPGLIHDLVQGEVWRQELLHEHLILALLHPEFHRNLLRLLEQLVKLRSLDESLLEPSVLDANPFLQDFVLPC